MSRHKGRDFHGHYVKAKGDRVFQLVELQSTKYRGHVVSYESWQAAKKDGWSHDQE